MTKKTLMTKKALMGAVVGIIATAAFLFSTGSAQAMWSWSQAFSIVLVTP